MRISETRICLLRIVRHEQHFSDLKFSSTSHEVENNDVAEIALHNLRRVAAIDALQRGRFFC
jgi:hypothetical protein